MNRMQALYRLQTLESSLDAAKNRLQEIETALSDSEALQAAQEDFEAKRDTFQQVDGTANDLQLELQGLTEKQATVNTLLYDNDTPLAPKEAQQRQDELESLKRREARLRDDLTSTREQLKFVRGEAESAETTLKEARKQAEAENKDLVQERKDLKGQMGGWLTERKATLKDLPKDTYRIYKKVKTKKNGIAVARLVESNTCNICKMEQHQTIVDSVRNTQDIVQCNNCLRILVDV